MSGKFVISIDFEKYWGVRDHKSLENYKTNLENVDFVIKKLLEIFKYNKIHVTWAIVGFMFYESKDDLIVDLPDAKEIYNDLNLNPYKYIEQNELAPKFHFSLSQIKQILENPYQEIASHTFSHYYCLENGQKIHDFELDCRKFTDISRKYNIHIKTIIFPRNQINNDYLEVLIKNGLCAYRGNEDHFIYKASSNKDNSKLKRFIRLIDRYINLTGHHAYNIDSDETLINVRSSRYLAPFNSKLALFENFRLNRIKKSMTYAAKNNKIFHLWWHPHNFGVNVEENLDFLEEIISHYKYLNSEYGFESQNIYEIVMENNI